MTIFADDFESPEEQLARQEYDDRCADALTERDEIYTRERPE